MVFYPLKTTGIHWAIWTKALVLSLAWLDVCSPSCKGYWGGYPWISHFFSVILEICCRLRGRVDDVSIVVDIHNFPCAPFLVTYSFIFCDYQIISNAVPLLDMISGFSTMFGCFFESHCHTPLQSNIKALYSVANGKFSFQCHRCPFPALFEGKVIHVSGACSALAG